MTAAKVVDASAVAALLFGEPDADDIASQFSGARLVAPTLIWFELANVCLIKGRRDPNAQGALAKAFSLGDRLHIQEIPVDYSEVLALATRTGLTAYDASYLWLAGKLGAELITLDRKLARAYRAPTH